MPQPPPRLPPQLPPAVMRAWDPGTPAALGGWMQLAGVDPAAAFASRPVADHPWVGLVVTFPFPEVGAGRVTGCLIHPRGELLFDVAFAAPVPHIRGRRGGPYEVSAGWQGRSVDAVHRFPAGELADLLGVRPGGEE